MTADTKPRGQLRRAIERTAERLKGFLVTEARATRLQAEDRAHLATIGDRPFLGCTPDPPSPRGAAPAPRHNPPARSRDAF